MTEERREGKLSNFVPPLLFLLFVFYKLFLDNSDVLNWVNLECKDL
jgi:hypothetical protein